MSSRSSSRNASTHDHHEPAPSILSLLPPIGFSHLGASIRADGAAVRVCELPEIPKSRLGLTGLDAPIAVAFIEPPRIAVAAVHTDLDKRTATKIG